MVTPYLIIFLKLKLEKININGFNLSKKLHINGKHAFI